MRKRNLLLCSAILLACWCGTGLADEGGASVQGTASFGTHLTDPTDHTGRVGEYINQADVEEFVADLYLDLFGSTQSTLYNLRFLHQDSVTKSFEFGLDTDKYVSAEMGYQSFLHNLDHDLLQNMQGKAGGKQVYHTDNDPLGKYFLEYSEFKAGVEVDIPFLPNGRIYATYSDRHKTGYVQEMTIDHCAFCHVESNGKRVDQFTETWRAGIQGTKGLVSFSYDVTEARFRDDGGENKRRWYRAVHPVYGTAGGEFSSRLNFQDVTMPYAQNSNNDKTTHQVQVKLDVPDVGIFKAAYTNANRRSSWTGIENQFDAYALGGAKRWNRDHRSTVRILAYETKVDDKFVNLAPYRAGDATYGNLDFDWTRISAANREVVQADFNHAWKLKKGRRLQGSLRYQIVDREAMAQSQTTYLFDGVNPGNDGATLVDSEPFANETKILRMKLRYDERLGRKGNFNAGITGKFVDAPFMNPTAMCEESVQDVHSAHTGGGAEDRLYYFQRQRYGMGTNQASESWRLNTKATYQLTPRASVNAFLSYTMEKNDELNIYEFERDVFMPGVNFWTAPTDRLLFTLGWTYSQYKSNANLCPPIFDG